MELQGYSPSGTMKYRGGGGLFSAKRGPKWGERGGSYKNSRTQQNPLKLGFPLPLGKKKKKHNNDTYLLQTTLTESSQTSPHQ